MKPVVLQELGGKKALYPFEEYLYTCPFETIYLMKTWWLFFSLFILFYFFPHCLLLLVPKARSTESEAQGNVKLCAHLKKSCDWHSDLLGLVLPF